MSVRIAHWLMLVAAGIDTFIAMEETTSGTATTSSVAQITYYEPWNQRHVDPS